MSIRKFHNASPIIYEKTANGEEMYDIYSRLLKERIVFLDSVLDVEGANNIISQFLWLEKQDSEEPIHLYINCYGGDIPAMFAIYDVMRMIKPSVYTFVLGVAASAAAVLLCAGEPGCRFALPHSEIMIHEPLHDGMGGSTTDMQIFQNLMMKSRDKMFKIIANHTGSPYEKIAKDCSRDFYLDAKEALKYGIIDKIKNPKTITTAKKPVATKKTSTRTKTKKLIS